MTPPGGGADIARRTDAELEEERQLILAAQQDRAAFAPLYERYVDRIFAYIYTLTRDRELAEDVTAATFAKGLEELPRFEWRGVPYSSWLYRVASNLVAWLDPVTLPLSGVLVSFLVVACETCRSISRTDSCFQAPITHCLRLTPV